MVLKIDNIENSVVDTYLIHKVEKSRNCVSLVLDHGVIQLTDTQYEILGEPNSALLVYHEDGQVTGLENGGFIFSKN